MKKPDRKDTDEMGRKLPRALRKPGKLKQFFSSRRAKYGSVAVIFTVVFVAAVLLLNVLVSSVSERTPLTVDLSASSYFTLSDASRSLCAASFSETQNAGIVIKFMMPEDRLKANQYYNMVVQCALQYREAFPHITVRFLDIVTRPSDVRDLRELGFDITSTSVAVECPSKNRVKVFGIESCFIRQESSSTYYGFDGEMQFTAALMAVSRDKTPVVTFTQGHGETVPVQMERMFTTAGYAVKRTNLVTETLDPATEIIVISDPQTDFLGLFAGENNEIDTLTEYLNSFKDMMVFLSPETQALPELDALCAELGVRVERGVALRDDVHSLASSGGATLIASYAGSSYLADKTDYSSIGSALHKSLSNRESPPMTLVPNAAPLQLLIDNTDGTGGQRSADTVLQSSENAYLLGEDGSRKSGVYPLMAISSSYGYVGDDTVYSHVLICGSAGFTETVAAGDSSYGNSEILYAAINLMDKETAPEGIHIKKLDDPSLSVSEGDAQTMLILMVTVLPVLVFVCGGVVFFKRRHK